MFSETLILFLLHLIRAVHVASSHIIGAGPEAHPHGRYWQGSKFQLEEVSGLF